LPAPSIFESNPVTPWRNVDQLLLDTLNKKVQGIQVKINVPSEETLKRYDHNFVTVVDGLHDLGNSTFSPNRVNHQQALPGQIAMSFLGEQGINAAPASVRRPDFMHSRAIAQELSRGRRSFLAQATANIADRVLSELSINESIEAAADEQTA
jgi:hypothetical protein